jgi:hypothetical protein
VDTIGLTGRISMAPSSRLSLDIGADAKRKALVLSSDWLAKAQWIFDEGSEAEDRTGSLILESYYADPAAVGRTTKGELDLALRLVDKAGEAGGLGGEIGFFADDVLLGHDPLPLAVLERLSYRFPLDGDNYIEPSEALGYNLDDPSGNPAYFYLAAGLEFQLFPNTAFLLEYEVGSILADGKGSAFLEGGNPAAGTMRIEITIGF